ncbi:MAG: HlyD family efflux transporter periplasmic adaptor subunit [Planctomycetota bacterium]|nr:HlyD family efflux transporter periplasmic adaptor subunit [Planctomycetota bacterium]MDA1211660.1 HlyD family efflux transporter periplasmic adaptor subunit [Planctomycetota bacterium]
MKRIIRRLLGIVILAGVFAAVGYSFMPQPVGADFAVVERGRLEVTVDEDGKTRIRDRYVVSAPLAGRLLRVELNPGDAVLAGKTLLTTIEPQHPELLDPRERSQAEYRVKAAEAALEQADPRQKEALASMQFAESELGRVQELFKKNTLTKQDVEEKAMQYQMKTEEYKAAGFAKEIARFELEQAKAARELYKTESLGDESNRDWNFEIYSPISGQVLNVKQESSTVVQAGAELLIVGNPADLELEVDVLSADAVRIHPGATVWLEQWGGDRPLRGKVRVIEPSAFTKISALGVEEQRVNVIVDMDEPYDNWERLGDGFRIEARIVIWEGNDVLKVPTSALFRTGDDWTVFKVVDNHAVLTTIKIGKRSGLEAEVLEGLSAGETVITHPSDKIINGTEVSAR